MMEVQENYFCLLYKDLYYCRYKGHVNDFNELIKNLVGSIENPNYDLNPLIIMIRDIKDEVLVDLDIYISKDVTNIYPNFKYVSHFYLMPGYSVDLHPDYVVSSQMGLIKLLDTLESTKSRLGSYPAFIVFGRNQKVDAKLWISVVLEG